ncbi:hypothetical protein MMC20_005809 [Loxospora ochrophaea]|nr:hypothetical protein [Loxospora ochrophaea]
MSFKYKSSRRGNARKIGPIIAILFTTLISVLLVWQRSQTSIGKFRNTVLNNPGTTSFLKQLVAGLLGALWVYVAGSVFNLTTRLRLEGDRTPTLQTLNVWVALGVQRIDFTLPVYYTVLTTIVLLAGHSIGALWAGAISPFPTTSDISWTGMSVPIFNENPPSMAAEFASQALGGYNDGEQNCLTDNGKSGFIPTCPVPGLQSLILSSASLATTWNNDSRKHAKNDNPVWTYVGRSYGVGSSQGLIDLTGLENEGAEVLAYNYSEPGYLTSSTCTNNGSGEFLLYDNQNTVSPEGSNLTINIFSAYGYLPNSDQPIGFPVLTTNLTGTEGLLTWAASGDNGQNMLSIAATDYYARYNSTICTITWTPTMFNVAVNFTNQTIYVEPQYSLPDATSFDSNEYLRTNTMASLGLLAQTSASMSYATLGQSLVNNWATYYEYTQFLLYGDGFNTNVSFTNNATVLFNSTDPLPALEDSIDAMIDDIIVGFGAAQLHWQFGGNGTGYAGLVGQFSAIRLGLDKYIFLTLAINIAILIIAIEEAIRTRNWHNISLFDYLDVKSVIVAASTAGTAVADEAHRIHKPGTIWEGDGVGKAAASIRVKVLKDDPDQERGPMIVLASDQKGEHDDGKTGLLV